MPEETNPQNLYLRILEEFTAEHIQENTQTARGNCGGDSVTET
jgi:hypothetical protein